jgi:cold-inducible RNA-binding protein
MRNAVTGGLPDIFCTGQRGGWILMKLYVGNLSYNVSDDQLQDLFSRFGTLQSARIITDRDSGQSKGFGFVEFSDDAEAKAALSLNGTEFSGRNLTVNEARPRNEASGNRSRY